MNAKCYRLVLDKRTGTLVPVADFVNSNKKGGRGGGSGGTTQEADTHPRWGSLAAAMLLTVGLGAPDSGRAQVVANPNASAPPSAMTAPNGDTTLVNIVDPNASGLSHNKFQEFNVGQGGLVFNNSLVDGQSQTAGYVAKNPNLNQSATGILAEVTGTNLSRIKGQMEVLGPRADLMIANPNGLYVNGMSVVNANQLVLTTGRPVGDGRQFHVEGGHIELGNANTQNLSHFDVVARSIALHGAVSGPADVGLAAGFNDFDARTRSATKHADGSGSDAPALAISATGSLYGRFVRMVSTEKGLGVRHEGQLTSAADLEVTANGDVVLRNIGSGGKAMIAGANVHLGDAGDAGWSGLVQGDLQVTADQRAMIEGRYDVRSAWVRGREIDARDVTLQAFGRIAGDDGFVRLAGETVRIAGGTWATDALSLTARKIDLEAATLAGDDVGIVAGDVLVVSDGGQVQAQSLTVKADALVNGGVFVGSSLRFALGAFDNRATGMLYGDALKLAFGPGLATNAGDIVGVGDVWIEGAGPWRNTGTLYATDLAMTVGDLENAHAGQIVGSDALRLTAGRLVNRGSASISGGRDATLTVRGDLDNLDDARIVADGGLTVAIDGSLRQACDPDADRSGAAEPCTATPMIGAVGDAKISVGGDLEQQGGAIQGNRVAISVGGDLTNRDEAMIVAHAGDLTISTEGDLDNRDGAVLYAGNKLSATVGGKARNTGADTKILGSEVDLQIAGALENSDQAVLHATSELNVNAQRLANNDGRLLAGLATGNMTDAGDMRLTLRGGLHNTQGGAITSLGNLWIDAEGNVRNDGNASIAGYDVFVTAKGGIDNTSGGKLQAEEQLVLKAEDIRNDATMNGWRVTLEAAKGLQNTGSITGGAAVWADAKDFANSGTIEAKQLVDLKMDTYRNTNKIYSEGDASLTIKNGLDLTFNDQARAARGDQNLIINANDVYFDRETQNLGNIWINTTGWIHNEKGVISGKSIIGTAQGDITNKHLLWAAEDVSLKGRSMRNRAGAEIEAMRDVVVDLDGTLTNEAGARIAAGRDAWIDAQVLRNEVTHTGGVVASGRENFWASSYTRQVNLVRKDTYGFIVQMPTLGSSLAVTGQGAIETGRNIALNQGAKKGVKADVVNAGRIQAGNDLYVDGDLDNLGITASMSLRDYLNLDGLYVIGAESNIAGANDSRQFTSLYALLEDVFSAPWTRDMNAEQAWYSKHVVNAMKAQTSPEFSKAMSRIFGADWRAVDYEEDLIPRWRAFKASFEHGQQSAFTATAGRSAEMAAGRSVVHTGGHLANGAGTAYGGNRPLSVRIGDQTIETIDGNFDVLVNLRELGQWLDPSQVWRDMADSGLKFDRKPIQVDPIDWTQMPPVGPIVFDDVPVSVVPLYETRMEFVDQGKFYGSDYFFNLIGFNSKHTVAVIGDNYFINELVNKQITQQVGSFMTVRDKISGADLVKRLMDNAGAVDAGLGLRVGMAPTAEQLAKLDRDIVWFVTQEVDGVQVLVPTVYLAAQTVADVQAERASGVASITAGEHIVIDADEVTNINGNLRAGKSIDISSRGKVTNVSDVGLSGGMQAGEKLLIDAAGDIDNVGAFLKGHDVSIVTDGNFTDTVRMGYDASGKLVVRNHGTIRGASAEGSAPSADAGGKSDMLADQAPEADRPATAATPTAAPSIPTAAERHQQRGSVVDRLNELDAASAEPATRPSQGSVSIQAKGDIKLTASDIQAQDVKLKAEGEIAVGDIHEVESSFKQETKAGFLTSVTTTTTTTNATSVGAKILGGSNGGSLTMEAGKDITLQGGEYGADVGVFQAKGDVITKTGQDFSHTKTHTVAEGISFGARVGVAGAGAAVGYGVHSNGTTGLAVNVAGFDGGVENPDAAGGRPNADGRAVLGETLGAEIGYKRVEITETHDTIKNKNAQLNFGSGVSIVADGKADIGGADIRAVKDDTKGDVLIQGAEVVSTKYEDLDRRTTHREESFVGFTASGQSSVVDAANKAKKMADDAERGLQIDAAMTAAQAAGDATNMVFNDALGTSVNFAIKHTEEKSSETTRKENINNITGNINIVSTQGDIKLAGVKLDGSGAGVTLDSARSIELTSAKESIESESSSHNHQISVGASASVAPTGAGIGVSAGYNGGLDTSRASGTTHTNSEILGSDVTIRSKGNTTLKGAEVDAHTARVDVSGNLRIESVQDIRDESGTRATWGSSVGASVNSQTLVGASISADAGHGESHDQGALTGSQSGIRATNLDVSVGGDLAMKGGQLVDTDGGGKVAVAGKITSERLEDFRDRDGLFVGGGGGVSKSGLADINIQIERDERINYQSEQLNTIAGVDFTAGGGVNGPINTDVDNTEKVLKDEHFAGNSVSATASVDDLKEGVNKLRGKGGEEAGAGGQDDGKPGAVAPRQDGRNGTADSAPRRVSDVEVRVPKEDIGGSSRPDADTTAPRQDDAPPRLADLEVRVPTEAPDAPLRPDTVPDAPVDKYDSRVIVDLGNDAVSHDAAANLAGKHPDNSVVLKPDVDGTLTVASGDPASLGGHTKVQVVGHGEQDASGNVTLGGKTPAEIAEGVAGLASDAPMTIDKVALVGCDTAACAPEVAERLREHGVEIGDDQVKGREGGVQVDADGHKATSNDPSQALGRHKWRPTDVSNASREPVESRSMNLYDEHGKYRLGSDPMEQRHAAEAFEQQQPIRSVPPVEGRADALRAMYEANGVTSTEIDSVDYYTREGYQYMNDATKAQRDEGIEPVDFLADHIAQTESFIRKTSTPLLDSVFKSVAVDQPIASLYDRFRAGDVLVDYGFTSTSLSPGFVKNFRGAPSEGNPILYFRIDGLKSGSNLGGIREDQGEVLVQRNTPFVVESISRVGGGNALLVGLREDAGQPGANYLDMRSLTPLPRGLPKTDGYDSRVIVDLGNDAVSHDAAANLAGKHPDNSVVLKPDVDGTLTVASGDPASLGGHTKVQVVGHGEQDASGNVTLGGRTPAEIAEGVAGLAGASDAPMTIDKVALVGCDTNACADGPSLAEQVRHDLRQQGLDAPVRGYDGALKVDGDGRKVAAGADDPDALGSTTDEPSHARPLPMEVDQAMRDAQSVSDKFGESPAFISQYTDTRLTRMEAPGPGGDLARSLTVEQYVALGLYTNENYRELNAALRAGGSLPAEMQALAYGVSDALANAPDSTVVARPVYRGARLPAGILDQISRTGVYSESAFLSASTNPGVAKRYGRDKSDGRIPVVFELRGRSVDVSSTSIEGGQEAEALFDRGSRFMIQEIVQEGPGYRIKAVQHGETTPGMTNSGDGGRRAFPLPPLPQAQRGGAFANAPPGEAPPLAPFPQAWRDATKAAQDSDANSDPDSEFETPMSRPLPPMLPKFGAFDEIVEADGPVWGREDTASSDTDVDSGSDSEFETSMSRPRPPMLPKFGAFDDIVEADGPVPSRGDGASSDTHVDSDSNSEFESPTSRPLPPMLPKFRAFDEIVEADGPVRGREDTASSDTDVDSGSDSEFETSMSRPRPPMLPKFGAFDEIVEVDGPVPSQGDGASSDTDVDSDSDSEFESPTSRPLPLMLPKFRATIERMEREGHFDKRASLSVLPVDVSEERFDEDVTRVIQDAFGQGVVKPSPLPKPTAESISALQKKQAMLRATVERMAEEGHFDERASLVRNGTIAASSPAFVAPAAQPLPPISQARWYASKDTQDSNSSSDFDPLPVHPHPPSLAPDASSDSDASWDSDVDGPNAGIPIGGDGQPIPELRDADALFWDSDDVVAIKAAAREMQRRLMTAEHDGVLALPLPPDADTALPRAHQPPPSLASEPSSDFDRPVAHQPPPSLASDASIDSDASWDSDIDGPNAGIAIGGDG